MERDFKCAFIFSAKDIEDSLVECAISTMGECDAAVILAESPQGINRVAEVQNTCENGYLETRIHIENSAARQYGIDTETVENTLNIASIIRYGAATLSSEDSIRIAAAIAKKYRIHQK